MTVKEQKHYKQQGFPEKIINETIKFLQDNNYTLFNLARITKDEYRVMFRNTKGKVDAMIFQIS